MHVYSIHLQPLALIQEIQFSLRRTNFPVERRTGEHSNSWAIMKTITHYSTLCPVPVVSWLDYSNFLLHSLTAFAICPIKRIQSFAALVINLRKSSHIIPLLCAQIATLADRICKNSIQAIIFVLHWIFSTPRFIKFQNFSFNFQDQQTIQTHLNKCDSSSVGNDLQLSTYLYSSTLTLMIALKTGSSAKLSI